MLAAAELVCVFLLTSILSWFLHYLHCFTYWKKKGVPSITPRFPFGNISKPALGRENIFVTIANYYHTMKEKGHKHAGLYFFNGPVYLPIDLQISNAILTTDFHHFTDRGMFIDGEAYPLSAHIFSEKGQKWKNLRVKLSPVFTSGKVKTMYNIFMEMTRNLVRVVGSKQEVNIKYVATNYTADLIFATTLGLESNTLQSPNNQLGEIAQKLFDPHAWTYVKELILEGCQNPGNIIKGLVCNTQYTDCFTQVVKSCVQRRDETSEQRKDLLSVLLDIRDNQGLTFNEVAAQTYLFFIAGFETSSQVISFCLHELAHNQDVQENLRREIFESLGEDYREYSYEGISRLAYLGKVFDETLRLYPVLGFLNRMCVKQYKVPNTDVVIEEGTPVLIPVLGIHRDPEYFPEPQRFDPERFGEGHKLTPLTYYPFGGGPRICTGVRYGTFQSKLAIASLVSQFRFSPSSKTPKVIEFNKFVKGLTMAPSEGIVVEVKTLSKRQENR